MAVEPSSEKKTLLRRRRERLRYFGGVCRGDELFGQQRGGFVGEAERGAVGDFAQLALDGGVEPGMVVPVQIGPDGGVGVEIFAAMHIPQHGALALHDDDRLALEPVAHLGERVPEVAVVEFGQRVHEGE